MSKNFSLGTLVLTGLTNLGSHMKLCAETNGSATNAGSASTGCTFRFAAGVVFYDSDKCFSEISTMEAMDETLQSLLRLPGYFFR